MFIWKFVIHCTLFLSVAYVWSPSCRMVLGVSTAISAFIQHVWTNGKKTLVLSAGSPDPRNPAF